MPMLCVRVLSASMGILISESRFHSGTNMFVALLRV